MGCLDSGYWAPLTILSLHIWYKSALPVRCPQAQYVSGAGTYYHLSWELYLSRQRWSPNLEMKWTIILVGCARFLWLCSFRRSRVVSLALGLQLSTASKHGWIFRVLGKMLRVLIICAVSRNKSNSNSSKLNQILADAHVSQLRNSGVRVRHTSLLRYYLDPVKALLMWGDLLGFF